MIWSKAWSPENLLRMESDRIKVRVGDQIFENFENFDFSFFMVSLKLVSVLGMKFHEISSLARISLPCGAAARLGSNSFCNLNFD